LRGTNSTRGLARRVLCGMDMGAHVSARCDQRMIHAGHFASATLGLRIGLRAAVSITFVAVWWEFRAVARLTPHGGNLAQFRSTVDARRDQHQYGLHDVRCRPSEQLRALQGVSPPASAPGPAPSSLTWLAAARLVNVIKRRVQGCGLNQHPTAPTAAR
jgi:hypothetical protein